MGGYLSAIGDNAATKEMSNIDLAPSKHTTLGFVYSANIARPIQYMSLMTFEHICGSIPKPEQVSFAIEDRQRSKWT